MIRIGVLGAARIAPLAIVRPARRVRGAEVTVVAARDRDKAEEFAKKQHIPGVVDSYDAVLEDPNVDAVYIPLPNGLHGAWTVRAIEAGKHVLCEKPFTANAAEAEQVAAVAKASDRIVMEAFHWRYHPQALRVLDIIDRGEIGDVTHVEAALAAPILKFGDIRWNLDLAGGSTMDMGCYPISFVRTMAGAEPTVRKSFMEERTPGVDRSMEAELDFPGGVTGKVRAAMLSGNAVSLGAKVVGTEGSIGVMNFVAPQIYSSLRINSRGDKRTERPTRRATYEFQLEAFVTAVESGMQPITDVDWAIANMRVVDDVYSAAGLDPRTPTPA